jgi:hypothetical protein
LNACPPAALDATPNATIVGEWLWTTTGPRAVDLAVNKSLKINAVPVGAHGRAVEVELENVATPGQRRHVPCEQESIGPFVIAHADVAKGVDDALVEEDACSVKFR